MTTYLGQSVSFVAPSLSNPYSVRYHFDIQRQLPWDTVLESGYAGNHAVHLTVNHNLNFIPNQYLSRLGTRDQATTNSLTANLPNPFAGLLTGTTLNRSTITASQLVDAYPQFTGVTPQSENIGSSYFQMFRTRIRKRFSGGVQALLNYQYSRLPEKTARLNGGDTALVKDVASDDRPQRLVMSGSWDLPFGHGKPFAAHSNFFSGATGGWSVNAIYTLQQGAPLINQPRNVAGVFDVTRFERDSTKQLLNNVRMFADRFPNLRQDGVNNLDFSAIKRFPVREKISLEYRAEFFNLLNYPLFTAPNLTPTSSEFGLITSQSNLLRRTQMALRLVW